jgi:hypothetical protein
VLPHLCRGARIAKAGRDRQPFLGTRFYRARPSAKLTRASSNDGTKAYSFGRPLSLSRTSAMAIARSAKAWNAGRLWNQQSEERIDLVVERTEACYQNEKYPAQNDVCKSKGHRHFNCCRLLHYPANKARMTDYVRARE